MSARAVLRAALGAGLAAEPRLAGALQLIGDAVPPRALLPQLRLDEPVLNDWPAAAIEGVEARQTLTLVARELGAARDLLDAAEAAIRAIPADLGDGWRLASRVQLRSRIAREGDAWRGTSDFRLRLARRA